MWSALKSDLNEFVTTVKDESNTVLASSQAAKSEGQEDAPSDSPQEKVESGHGIIMGEDGEVIYEDSDGGAVMEEIDRLVREEETFTEPLDEEDEEVMEFLKDFNIEQKTDDISKLLEEYPDTLQIQFESLVPTPISYKEFWQRYYFRCDADRIQRQWFEEEEAARKAREEAIAKTVRGVKNLFGGAVKAVSSTLQAADDGVDAVTTPFEATPPPTGSNAGLFGASGRPPFVMNTAVDEDEDDEEEELGWDDDEEDLDVEEEEEEEDEEYAEGESEEITFSGGKNEEIEKLQEQLSQAMEERDQLHNTVEMQAQEISRLQSGCDAGAPPASDDALQKLKMEIFEKDSELAALKASLEDTQDDSVESATKKDAAKLASQERELEQLRGALSAKESEISEFMQELDTSSARVDELVAKYDAEKAAFAKKEEELTQVKLELEKSCAEVERLMQAYDAEKAAHATASAEKKELAMQVATLQEQLAASQSEAEMLRQTVETVNSGTESQVTSALEEASAAKAQVDALMSRVEELKGNLHFSTGRAEHLERELQEAKDALTKQEAEFTAKLADEIAKVHAEHEQLSSGTQNSESTGVKVGTPTKETTPTVTKIDGDEDDMDDWGDDWGDEDE